MMTSPLPQSVQLTHYYPFSKIHLAFSCLFGSIPYLLSLSTHSPFFLLFFYMDHKNDGFFGLRVFLCAMPTFNILCFLHFSTKPTQLREKPLHFFIISRIDPIQKSSSPSNPSIPLPSTIAIQ